MSDLAALITPLTQIVKDAGNAILEVYNSPTPIEIENKADDSPVTKADYAAHEVIEKGLRTLPIQYPILSEEGGLPEFSERQKWERYWLVDPLDGTKEFINKNGEFTVNIALIDKGEAILGFVYVPVKRVLYYGGLGIGSFRCEDEAQTQIQKQALTFDKALNVVGSRRHGADALDKMLEGIRDRFPSVELISMGSSLKICACADGSADWYPRLALTSEWDTAAAHAVLSAAGGEILDEALQPLKYNQKDSLLNPYFHAVGDKDFAWSSLISAKA
jgi:3'(2'), 5'-bisphosphate nucleotidase